MSTRPGPGPVLTLARRGGHEAEAGTPRIAEDGDASDARNVPRLAVDRCAGRLGLGDARIDIVGLDVAQPVLGQALEARVGDREDAAGEGLARLRNPVGAAAV